MAKKKTIEEVINSCKNEDFLDSEGPTWREYEETLKEKNFLQAENNKLLNKLQYLSQKASQYKKELDKGKELLIKAIRYIKALERKQRKQIDKS